jgi:hypothetical protein
MKGAEPRPESIIFVKINKFKNEKDLFCNCPDADCCGNCAFPVRIAWY